MIGKKNDFSELRLPGVESVPTPRGSILHASVGPKLPKTAKIKIFEDLGIYFLRMFGGLLEGFYEDAWEGFGGLLFDSRFVRFL